MNTETVGRSLYTTLELQMKTPQKRFHRRDARPTAGLCVDSQAGGQSSLRKTEEKEP